VSAPSSYRARRATTDDLDSLKAMWTGAGLSALDLEKQFTDFQVVEDANGRILGAVAMQIDGPHGRVHSEAFVDFGLTDTLRPLLWERLQNMAGSHGLYRLWTSEAAPFWKKDAGFSAATAQPPETFGPKEGGWLTLRLKDESADPNLLEMQFNLFREAERAKREKLLQSANALKMFGTGLAVLLFVFAIIVLITFFRHRPQLMPLQR
jgi:N-acetylglutamate synthase-like GNAT family acetyltransferase